MTPANPRRKSVRLLETFSLEVLSCQKADDQVCTASIHEVLVASGIVGVCKVQVPEDSLLADHFLSALSTALASQLDCWILAEETCTTDCCSAADPAVRMRAAAQHFGGSTGGFVADPTIDTDEHCIHVFLFQHHNRESCKLVRLTQASVGEDISLGQICIDLGLVLLHGGRHWRAEVARQNAIHTDACGSAPV